MWFFCRCCKDDIEEEQYLKSKKEGLELKKEDNVLDSKAFIPPEEQDNNGIEIFHEIDLAATTDETDTTLTA